MAVNRQKVAGAALVAVLLLTGSAASARLSPRGQVLPALMRVSATVVRARLVPDGYSAIINRSGTAYQGKVTTIPGVFQGLGPVASDPDTGGLIATVSGSPTILELVALNGKTSQITTFNGSFPFMVYDQGSQLIYAPEGCTVVTVSPSTGVISTLAGSSTCGTNDGQGANAQFQGPTGIALDGTNKILYVADKDRIRSVSESGLVKTVTAPGSIGPPNGLFCFDGPSLLGLTFDPDNAKLYLADTCSELIRRIDPTHGSVATLAGQCILLNSAECEDLYRDGHGTSAFFSFPSDITYDHADGFLYVSEYHNNLVRRVSTTGDVTTLAGNGHNEFRNGVGPSAAFNAPIAIAANVDGTIAVADVSNSAIRQVVADGPTPPPPPHGMTLLDPPTPGEAPVGIAAAPDGSMIYTAPASHILGRIATNGAITEVQLPSNVSPGMVAVDAAGDVWFTNNLFIGEYTAGGTLLSFPIPSGNSASDIAIGADGNPWFVAGQSIGVVIPSGSVVQYSIDAASSLAAGFSSDLWTLGAIQSVGGFVDRVSTQGAVLQRLEFQDITIGPIARGPGNKMWIGQAGAIGAIYPHNILLYQLPISPYASGEWGPLGLVEGPDKALWFTANLPGYIGRMTSQGAFTPHEIPAPRTAPESMAVGANGAIWFTDPGALKIGRWF
ncbi:MAG TPA: hypothetical protein VFO25_00105 [Candidatus Eremiobacteraceae bacterium]|nr:hypothetical protein [Candidatus Eremiobacteraceae bacterium]